MKAFNSVADSARAGVVRSRDRLLEAASKRNVSEEPQVADTSLDPAVEHLVAAQWALVADRVDTPLRLRRALTQRGRSTLLARAGSLPRVAEYSGLSEQSKAIYAMPENKGRLVRILDFVCKGDRVVDIGSGQGSVGVRLLKSGRLSSYVGIELSPRAAASFHGMAEENGVDPSDYRIDEGSAFDLAPEIIPQERPTLVTVLEVLEHVPDPEGLLAAVGEGLPIDCDVIISVPLLGEIEHDWGHVSVFDRHRIEAMARGAGMHVHWVEALMGQWLLCVLSKSPSQRPRIMKAEPVESRNAPGDAAAPEAYSFRRVDLQAPGRVAPSAYTVRRTDDTLTRDGTRVTVRAAAGEWCGVTVLAPGIDVIRLQVQTEQVADAGLAEFRGDGRPIESWTLDDLEFDRLVNGRTLVFRRGFGAGRQHRNHRPGIEPERFEFAVRSDEGPITLHVKNAAWIPAVGTLSQPRAYQFDLV